MEGFRLGVADPGELTQGRFDERAQTSRSLGRIVKAAVLSLFEPAAALAHTGHKGKPLLHSARFVLVDREGRIRGYYRSDDEEQLGRLRRDLRTLLRARGR